MLVWDFGLGSISVVVKELLDENESFDGLSDPPPDEFDSRPGLLARGCGRRIFPAVPSEPSFSARWRALASVSCNFFVASFGSAALFTRIRDIEP